MYGRKWCKGNQSFNYGNLLLLLPTLTPLSRVSTTCFSSCCVKIRQLFYDRPPVWRQPSLKLEWVLTTANATFCKLLLNVYFVEVLVLIRVHTYQLRLILTLIHEGVAGTSEIFLRDVRVLPKWLSYDEYCKHDRWWAHRCLIAI
jgi:hypothetical protein